MSSFDDPLEALEFLITKGVAAVHQERAKTFCGPNATFHTATEQTDPARVERFQDCLRQIDIWATNLRFPADVWNRLRQLSYLRSGAGFEPKELLELLGSHSHEMAGPPVFPAQEKEVLYFRSAIAKLESFGYHNTPDKWTAADWQLLGFVHDALQPPESKRVSDGIVRERTPIFLANETVGKVLWLVAERLPGPPGLMTPHWWKLGLAPLGANGELLTAIHYGFVAFLNSQPNVRCQIRWWLELHPDGGAWPDRVGEADSVQVAAACVARALFEHSALHPLLDPKAGVSATLPDHHGADLKNRPVGDVGFVQKKFEAAGRAGVLTFLVQKGSVLPVSTAGAPQVIPVVTFDDAYEALLMSATYIQNCKREMVRQWDICWANTETGQEFIDASKRNSDGE